MVPGAPGNGDVDLEPGRISLSADYVAFGEDLTVTLPINNLEDGSTGDSFWVTFYMSEDSTFNPDQETRAFAPVEVAGGIGANGSIEIAHTVTMPAVGSNQCVYFYAVVDSVDDKIGETDETNNTSTPANAGCILAYNSNDSNRTYDMVFETFPPEGTAPAQQPNTVVYLYKKSTGAQIGFSFVQNYSKIVRTGAEALLPDTYFVKIDQFALGPYGFSVRTSESMPIIYFNEELSSDPFEDDDAVDADGMPLNPVSMRVSDAKNRYIDLGDADWFEIYLP